MNYRMPVHVWMETRDSDDGACDVIVEMEDGSYYSALFVTLPYLRRQMELTYDLSLQLPDVPSVRYCTMETPHILVETLSREVIEDTLDNLIALDTFESLFTLVMKEDIEDLPDQRLRTAEIAAVVLNDVLQVDSDTVA